MAPHVFEILLSLSAGERHGYELVRDIRERTGGVVDLGTSTLYAAIRRLLQEGWVEEAGEKPEARSSGPPRRYYRITPLGREAARLEVWRLEAAFKSARSLLGQNRAKGALR